MNPAGLKKQYEATLRRVSIPQVSSSSCPGRPFMFRRFAWFSSAYPAECHIPNHFQFTSMQPSLSHQRL